jgi:hypothetical protein
MRGTLRHGLQVAANFRLTREDLGEDGWQTLTEAVPLMLQQPSTCKAAVHLLMQFEVGLGACCDKPHAETTTA